MMKREKVIVGVMVATVAYAGYYFLAPASNPSTIAQKPENLRKDTEALIKASRMTLSEAQLGADVQYAEAGIAMPWLKNPFAPRVTIAVPDEEELPSVAYTGFMVIDGREFALLNGRAYESQDRLPGGRYHVQSISETHVVLFDGSRTNVVKLSGMVTEEEP